MLTFMLQKEDVFGCKQIRSWWLRRSTILYQYPGLLEMNGLIPYPFHIFSYTPGGEQLCIQLSLFWDCKCWFYLVGVSPQFFFYRILLEPPKWLQAQPTWPSIMVLAGLSSLMRGTIQSHLIWGQDQGQPTRHLIIISDFFQLSKKYIF